MIYYSFVNLISQRNKKGDFGLLFCFFLNACISLRVKMKKLHYFRPMLECPLCKNKYKKIDKQHLKKHNLTVEEYFIQCGENAPYGYSEELRLAKSGEHHPLKGKPRSEETKIKVSDGLKKMWADHVPTEDQRAASKKNIQVMGASNKGRTHDRSEDYKASLSKTLLEYYKNNPKSGYAGSDRYATQLSHLEQIAEKRRVLRFDSVYEKLSSWAKVDTAELDECLIADSTLETECKKCGTLVKWSLANYRAHSFSETSCPGCFPRLTQQSKAELEIGEFVKSHGISIEQRYKLPSGLELDIYCRDKQIAIEYHGLYWHSSAMNYKKEKHKVKREQCEKLGIELIQIYEDEWQLQKSKVENLLLVKFGISKAGFYARKTIAKRVPYSVVAPYLDEMHLQGKGSSCSYCYALFSGDLIVGAVTLSKSRAIYGGNSDDFELVRYASSGVVGGFTKLMRLVRQDIPGTIISYADLRYVSTVDNVYLRSGFVLSGITLGYQYTDLVKRYHRWAFRKNGANTDLSEKEYWQKSGYYQIFDAGQAKYICHC